MYFFPQETQDEHAKSLKVHRFDIFKGVVQPNGQIRKVRTVGSARLSEGYATYIVQLKLLLGATFYMLPDREGFERTGCYSLLTREDSTAPGKRFFWNKVGEGIKLASPNQELVQLCWDVFGADDIYMSLIPLKKPSRSWKHPP